MKSQPTTITCSNIFEIFAQSGPVKFDDVFASGGFTTGPYFKVLLMMAWGGVGWGCNNVHVCCLTCDATLILRSCLGGVGWGGLGRCKNVHVCCLTCDATLILRSCLGGVGWCGVGGVKSFMYVA